MTTPQEIWTTRLQREILALVDESNEKKDIGILPAFINYHKHDLDIARGTCSVSFAITVEGIDRASKPLVAGSNPASRSNFARVTQWSE